MIPIRYSRGASQFDNKPAQREAVNFAAFADAFLADQSATKGKTYICAPFAEGNHNKPDDYPGIATWRQKHLAQPRAYLPFDFDGFDTPEAFALVRDWLGRFQGFAYTTATFPDVDQRIINRAGFYRDTDGEREYLVLPEVFRREVCEGFDEKRGKAALLDAGMLIPGKDGKPAQLLRLPGIGPTRAYVLRYAGGDE